MPQNLPDQPYVVLYNSELKERYILPLPDESNTVVITSSDFCTPGYEESMVRTGSGSGQETEIDSVQHIQEHSRPAEANATPFIARYFKIGNVIVPDVDVVTLPYSETDETTTTEEQWSPLNPEGEKQYDREFLLCSQQKRSTLSSPDNLPDLPDVIVENEIGESQWPRNVSLDLHKAESSWIKSMQERKMEVYTDADQEKSTEELFRKMRGILNKLTTQLFPKLIGQIQELEINTEARLTGVIDLIFEKAIDEPNFSVPYALLCKILSSLVVQPEGNIPGAKPISFRVKLLARCQAEFEKDKANEIELSKREAEIQAEDDEKKKKMLELELEEAQAKSKRRSTGNIQFIGELFKLKMLSEKIMHQCLTKLLQQKDEESLECLCCLLTTIGEGIDQNTGEAKTQMDSYFIRMQTIIDEKLTSARIRFMLLDIIDLRQNNWVPRLTTNYPKTIDQIHKEAAAKKKREAIMAAWHNQSTHVMSAKHVATTTPSDVATPTTAVDDDTANEPLATPNAVDRKSLPKIELKYNYKEDQWSPLNPEGKKQYDREFLLSLQMSSLTKPENLPDLPDVILENSAIQSRFNEQHTRPLRNKSYTNSDFFTPGYVKSMVGTGSGSRQAAPTAPKVDIAAQFAQQVAATLRPTESTPPMTKSETEVESVERAHEHSVLESPGESTKEDQSSPLNRMNEYDREFLLRLRNKMKMAGRIIKPDNLPDLPDVILENSVVQRRINEQYTRPLRNKSYNSPDFFTPGYVKSMVGTGSVSRQTAPTAPKVDIAATLRPNESTPPMSKSETEVESVERAHEHSVLELPGESTKEYQSSPLNRMNEYDREFLLRLRNKMKIAGRIIKPYNLPDLPDVILENSRFNEQHTRPLPNKSYNNSEFFTPGYVKSMVGTGSVSRRDQKPQPLMSITIAPPVALHKAESSAVNSVQNRKKDVVAESDEERRKTDELLREMRFILNNLTPEKFMKLIGQIQELEINTERRCTCVIDLIFEKAIDEPTFNVSYALVCKTLFGVAVQKEGNTSGVEYNHFRGKLVARCQAELEDNVNEIELAKRKAKIQAEGDKKKKKMLELELKEAQDKSKRRSTGSIRFIGELFKLKMVPEEIMHQCLTKLLQRKDEESLECLCVLLKAIGKGIDQNTVGKSQMDIYVTRMNVIMEEKSTTPRIGSLIMNFINLRRNSWVHMRTTNDHKTVDHIKKEAATEKARKAKMTVHDSHMLPNKGRGRGRGRGGPVWRQRGGSVGRERGGSVGRERGGSVGRERGGSVARECGGSVGGQSSGHVNDQFVEDGWTTVPPKSVAKKKMIQTKDC